MKLKLLTIGILALFLLSTLPAAATAAKPQTTVREQLYMNSNTGTLVPIDGTIKLDTTTGQFSASAKGLTPGATYRPFVISLTTFGSNFDTLTTTTYTADAQGHLKISTTIDANTLGTVNLDFLPYSHNFGLLQV